MSEVLNFRDRIVRPVRAAGAAVALTIGVSACELPPQVPAPIQEVVDDLTPEQVNEREAARQEIKAMQRALNRRELYKGATMVDATFIAEAEEQTDTIYAPVKVGNNSYGYFEVNPKTCKVIGRFIDGALGEFSAGYGPITGEWTPSEREVDLQIVAWGSFERLNPGDDIPEQGCVVAANDERGSFVGQHHVSTSGYDR